ncbi:MAG: YfbK domain-containing protein, partial [Flavobacteriaceae bacterium]
LEAEDFIDDSKDAGELGSGHTVTALYEVVPVGIEIDYVIDVTDLKYTVHDESANFSSELLTVKLRYKKPLGSDSIEMEHILEDAVYEMSDDFKFASAVALFGMQLRKSAYTNKANLENVLQLANAGRVEDEQGYRAEFIRLVKAVETSL